jgi:type IV/VI secretion system ImpK/VasF family protein
MKHKIWPSIHNVFNLVEKKSTAHEDLESQEEASDEYDSLLQLRKELRTSLFQLKKVLSSNMIERDVYFILFPIVVYLDEKVQLNFFKIQERSWALLQQEFFDTENGGVMFYDVLDNILKNEDTPQLVHETFFYCLNAGFLGKNTDNPNRIESYLEILKNKIPLNPVQKRKDEYQNSETNLSGYAPKWLYIGVGILFCVVYFSIISINLSS